MVALADCQVAAIHWAERSFGQRWLGVNRQLAGEVGATAQHAYRRRFLHDLARARQEGRAEAPASVSREPKPTGPPAPKVRLPKPPSYD